MSEEESLPLLQITEPGAAPEETGEAKKAVAVGIDLGTTNSVIAVSRDGAPKVLEDDMGEALVPSVVAYAPDGSAIVGGLAKRLLLDRPESVVSSIKRLMGRGPEDVKSLAGVMPFEIEPYQDGETGMVRIKVMGHRKTPVEVSADILAALKSLAEEEAGEQVEQAVITVPAYFDDAARTATKDAAQLAGLEVLRLINEPTAAALAYGLDQGAEGLYAVYDLGGGTFDISLLRMEKGVFQVKATGGDAALGGDDFDHAIAEHFLKERAKTLGEVNLTRDEVKVSLMTGRLAKECLTHEDSGQWVLESGGQTSSHDLTRDEFEKLIEGFVDRTLEICSHVLDDAEVTASDVKGVVLVGGSTRVPLVRRKVQAFFGSEPLADIDPDKVVAVGASLQAEALTVGSDTLLLDVTPLSLGLETMGEMTEKVIHRNTPIPVAKAQEFTTYQDGQTAMMIHVVQGEREMVDQCRSLARFVLKGIPPMTAGAARIRVTFQVDADGLLTVSAREETTGVEQMVEVKPSYGLSEDEMANMLRDSMVHAKDDIQDRLLAESRVEASRVLNAVIAALQVDGDLLSGDERAKVDNAVTALDQAIKGSMREEIDAAVDVLDKETQEFAARRMDRGIRDALSGVEVDVLEEKISEE